MRYRSCECTLSSLTRAAFPGAMVLLSESDRCQSVMTPVIRLLLSKCGELESRGEILCQ